ncbi:MAG: hypothetical protein V7703_01075 [Hyphomicrobiales bacterium]
MRFLLLLISSFSLVLAGALFSHQDAYALGDHQHGQVLILDEVDDHDHVTLPQSLQDADTAQLHCGSNILALVNCMECHFRITDNDLPFRQKSFENGVWAKLDPPPPRRVPEAR